MAQAIPQDTQAVDSPTIYQDTTDTTKQTNAQWALVGVLNDLNEQINQAQLTQINLSSALADKQAQFAGRILNRSDHIRSFKMKSNWVKITGTVLTGIAVGALVVGTGGAALPIAAGLLGACLDIAGQGMDMKSAVMTKDLQQLNAGSQNTNKTSQKLSDNLKQSYENQANIKDSGYEARKNMNSSHYIN